MHMNNENNSFLQLGTKLKTAESKLPKKKKKRTLGDVAVIEILEEICTKDGFEK